MFHRSVRLLLVAFVFGLLVVPITADDHTRTDLLATGDPYDAIRFDDRDPGVPTPRNILGHDIGERFTRHAEMIGYLRVLADASDRVHMHQYGRSVQGRPLVTLTITSPENHARLPRILERNAELTTGERNAADRARSLARDSQPALVWFSFGVHGNEGSNMETAIQLAYILAAARGERIDGLLRDLVLVIDPSLNPDGQMRYVTWFQNIMGSEPNAHRWAAERSEPWPGGRSNHYLFDLNRDWSWLVQPESLARLRHYRAYRPQVHVDFHEQGADSPHFFGEGDTPYNLNIPISTREWLAKYTEDLSRAFDEFGLLYSTRERFDYLYPGYGKVTPVYHGAMSVLNEQAGHSRGGLAIEVEPGYTLTLAERIRNQLIVAITYLETTQRFRAEQLERFASFFREAVTDENSEIYFIARDNDPALLAKVWTLAEVHGFRIETLDRPISSGAVLSYQTGEPIDNHTLPAGTWVIRSAQPMGFFIKTLFEREPEIEDPDTYDITAWSLPVVFGLDAWYAKRSIPTLSTSPLAEWTRPTGSIEGDGRVAIMVPSTQYHFPHALGLAAHHALHSRLAGDAIEMPDGVVVPPGSLIVHTQRNDADAVRAFERDLVSAGLTARRLARGISTTGPVLGANANRRFVHPRIAIVRDRPTSSLDFGATWHLFDVEQRIDHTIVLADQLGRLDLDQFNVLIIPNCWGSIGAVFDDRIVERLDAWVRSGGTLVGVGSAGAWASGRILRIDGSSSDDDESSDKEERPVASALTFEERRARSVEDRIPGALLQVRPDTTHPIMFGAPEWLGAVVRSGRTLPVRDNGFVLARYADQPRLAGVLSDRNASRLANQPAMTLHRHSGGVVICIADEVATRGFTHAAQRLLLNAATLGPSMTSRHQPLGDEID
ncbi:MAG: hypothetical protein EA380_10870 [Phycisphaeraceae bacterium]|nr:MAG: hypothetical protein EA380_10870 [Phycisphaeraceae bacterium]